MQTVLIADDSLFIRTNMKDIINKSDYELAGEAANGQEAVERYRDLHPDVVLLDITMPVLNGIGALKAIMSYDPNAKVIMCSAMGQQKFVEEAIRYGAKDFLVKPFKSDRVLLAIKKVICS